jgi:hypothetical protein
VIIDSTGRRVAESDMKVGTIYESCAGRPVTIKPPRHGAPEMRVYFMVRRIVAACFRRSSPVPMLFDCTGSSGGLRK